MKKHVLIMIKILSNEAQRGKCIILIIIYEQLLS